MPEADCSTIPISRAIGARYRRRRIPSAGIRPAERSAAVLPGGDQDGGRGRADRPPELLLKGDGRRVESGLLLHGHAVIGREGAHEGHELSGRVVPDDGYGGGPDIVEQASGRPTQPAL